MTKTNIWFYYEKQPTGKWATVVRYGDRPQEKGINGANPQTQCITELVAEDLEPNGEAKSFGYLEKKYPREQELIVARKAEGFLTSDGQFFDTEKEAKAYEAALNLNSSMLEALRVIKDQKVRTFISEQLIHFIKANYKIVSDYINDFIPLMLEQKAPENAPPNTDDDETDVNSEQETGTEPE